VELVLAQAVLDDPQMLTSVLALIAGILILIIPRLLNFIVATYLIVVGILGIIGGL
jgi:hypothetical protein